jgi:hypothetical protein
MQANAFLEVVVAGWEFETLSDEGFGIHGNEIGLVAVDALVVSGAGRLDFTSDRGSADRSAFFLGARSFRTKRR